MAKLTLSGNCDPKPEQVPVDVVVYHDKHADAWFCFRVDADGNQVGESANAYRKRDLMVVVRQWKKWMLEERKETI